MPSLLDEVMSAGVRQRIKIGVGRASVEFDVYVEENNVYYSWTVRDSGFGFTFPLMSDQKTIKYFKTLAGAKRNFLRTFKIGQETEDVAI